MCLRLDPAEPVENRGAPIKDFATNLYEGWADALSPPTAKRYLGLLNLAGELIVRQIIIIEEGGSGHRRCLRPARGLRRALEIAFSYRLEITRKCPTRSPTA